MFVRVETLQGEFVFGIAFAQAGKKAGESECGHCKRRRGGVLNRASEGLESIVAKALRRAPASESVMLAWPLACGSAVADRTRALDFAEGILRVEVPDAGWRRELMNLAPRYVAVINNYSGAVVRRIEFVCK